MKYNTDLLNTTIEDIFFNKTNLLPREILDLKSQFATYLKHIEMVFGGLFTVDYDYIDNDDEELFNKAFPFISKVAKAKFGSNYIKNITGSLVYLRNFFMHGISHSLVMYETVEGVVDEIPNFSDSVKYKNNGKLTFAGLVAYLYCFSNDKMILYFIKKSRYFSKFIMQINPVNFNGDNREKYAEEIMNSIGLQDEIDIRNTLQCENLLEAIFGKMLKYANCIDNKIVIKMSDEDKTSISLEASYFNNCIIVTKGSYFLDYFENDYKLEIADLQDFINLSSSLPPFYLLAHLWKAGITKFNKNTLTAKDLEMIDKYNHPKYYVDKNINTLFIPNTQADARALGQVITSPMLYLFINFEEVVYKHYRIKDSTCSYSRTPIALREIGITGELLTKLIALRNFFAHKYILGDYIRLESVAYKVDMNFIFSTMDEFFDYLLNNDEHLHKLVKGDFVIRVCSTLIYFKYGDVVSMSEAALGLPYNKEVNDNLDTKDLRVRCSTITPEIENELVKFTGDFRYNFKDKFVAYITKSVVYFGKRKIVFYTTTKPKFDIIFKGCELELVSEEKNGFLLVRNYLIIK